MVGHIMFLFPTFIRTYSDPLKTVGLITVGHNPEDANRTYSVIHQYLFMAETIFEHLKYQLDQN
jgi:hypothetical protein